MTSLNMANGEVFQLKKNFGRGFKSTLKSLEVMKKKGYAMLSKAKITRRDDDGGRVPDIARIFKRPRGRCSSSLQGMVTARVSRTDSSPTRGTVPVRAEDGKEKAETPVGNVSQATFLSFKRPKRGCTLETRFSLLETEQANSTFKHFPVFQEAEGG